MAQKCPLANITHFLLLPFLLDFESWKVFFVKDLVEEVTQPPFTWPKILQSSWVV